MALLIEPTLPDRILALDTMYINTIALIVLYGIKVSSGLYFEAALLIAMLGLLVQSLYASFCCVAIS